MTGRVGIIGGYGAVGAVVAERLSAWGVSALRLGGRRPEQADAMRQQLSADVEAVAVDVANPAAVRRFCAGCDVVVNCAGPSYRILDTVARAAVAEDAHYVDAGGDDPVYERLADLAADPGTARLVLSAGMAPGLTGLFPRWLAGQGFAEVRKLTAYVAARDRFTEAAAGDYLMSLSNGYGAPMAAWRAGTVAARALEPRNDVELPYFAGRMNAYPFLSTETERTAVALGLSEVDWYNVFDADGQMLSAMARVSARFQQDGDLAPAVAELVRTAHLDLFGRGPQQQLVLRMDGLRDGEPVSRVALLKAGGTYRLTGVLSAVAVRAILHGEVSPGVWFAADALSPDAVVAELRGEAGVSVLEVFDEVSEEDESLEEGVL